MATYQQNGTGPYFNGNPPLKDEVDAAARQAIEVQELPADNEGNFDDGYSWHNRVASLEGKIFALDDELKSLKEKCRNWLYISEAKRLLQNLEENLALYLYPRGWGFGKSEIFPNLIKWLNVRRGTPLGEVPNNKWLEVQRSLPWTPQHEEVLAKFRNLLPDVTQAIELWNPVSLNDAELKCVGELEDLSQQLTQLIEKQNENYFI